MSKRSKASVLNVLSGAMVHIDERQGQEFYTKPYDRALHIYRALKDAGFTIVKARARKEGQ